MQSLLHVAQSLMLGLTAMCCSPASKWANANAPCTETEDCECAQLLAPCSSLVQNGPRGRREREFYELVSRLVALDRTAALESQQGDRDFGQVPFPLMSLG